MAETKTSETASEKSKEELIAENAELRALLERARQTLARIRGLVNVELSYRIEN